MDPVEFMLQSHLNYFTLGVYLGPRFTSEEAEKANEQGKKLLRTYGVIPDKDTPAKCPECKKKLSTVKDNARHGFRFVCSNHRPIRRYGPYQNTFLERVRISGDMSADRIICIIYMWLQKHPVSHTAKQLQLAQDTAVNWYSFCREVACAIAWHDFLPIGGQGDIVEVESRHSVKCKNNENDAFEDVNRVWVVGGISRTTKKRFAVVVAQKEEDIIMPILEKCIEFDSFICTEKSPVFDSCSEVFSGHGVVSRIANFVDPPINCPPIWASPERFNSECLDPWRGPPPKPGMQPYRHHMQNFERCWKDLKPFLRSNNTNSEAINTYIGEWMYRKNLLEDVKDDKMQFQKFLFDIARVYPGVGKKPMKNRFEDIDDCDCHMCVED